jgi:hypothetical protein
MQKKKNLIAPILFLCYEESVCPLILKYNKVYFETSLITKPNLQPHYGNGVFGNVYLSAG